MSDDYSKRYEFLKLKILREMWNSSVTFSALWLLYLWLDFLRYSEVLPRYVTALPISEAASQKNCKFRHSLDFPKDGQTLVNLVNNFFHQNWPYETNSLWCKVSASHGQCTDTTGIPGHALVFFWQIFKYFLTNFGAQVPGPKSPRRKNDPPKLFGRGTPKIWSILCTKSFIRIPRHKKKFY